MPALDREELAWAAGFFDGEGHTRLTNRVPLRRRDYPAPRMSIGQTDVEVLEHFQSAIGGYGRVNGPYNVSSPLARSPLWTYQLNGFEGVQYVITVMWPWLGTQKRIQAAEVFGAYLLAAREWRRYTRRPLQPTKGR